MRENTPIGCSIFTVLVSLFAAACWIINLVKLLNCDFIEPWKDEIIHLIGLVPGVSLVTAWM